MGGPGGTIINAEAVAAAAEQAKVRDYYADLTDEEREEEGLPPREPEKAEPEPAKTPEKGNGSDDGDEKDGSAEEDEATSRLFDEIASLREDIGNALGKPGPAPDEEKEDTLLAAALDHDDPVIRGLAERLQSAEQRLGAREAEAQEQRVAAQLAKDAADFDAVRSSYTIGGKAMTAAQIEQVEDYILKNPEIGSRLSIEQITRVVHPDAVKTASGSSAGKGPAGAAGERGPRVATIVDTGSTGGAPAGGWKPKPNETIESAIQEAGRRFGWKR